MPRKNSKVPKIKAGPTKAQTSHKRKNTPQEHMLSENQARLEANKNKAVASHRPVAAQYGATQVARVTGLMTKSELSAYNRGGRIGAGGMAASHGGAKSPWGKKNTPPLVAPAHNSGSYSPGGASSSHTSGSGSSNTSSTPSTPKPKKDKELGKKYAAAVKRVQKAGAMHGKKTSAAERKEILTARRVLRKMRKNLAKKGYGKAIEKGNGKVMGRGIYKALTGKSASTLKK